MPFLCSIQLGSCSSVPTAFSQAVARSGGHGRMAAAPFPRLGFDRSEHCRMCPGGWMELSLQSE
jgi:hypothetical protein